jgi:hypothetical protein
VYVVARRHNSNPIPLFLRWARTHDLVEARPRRAFGRQMDLIGANLFQGELVLRLAEILAKLCPDFFPLKQRDAQSHRSRAKSGASSL